jgi:transposase InsO family protein
MIPSKGGVHQTRGDSELFTSVTEAQLMTNKCRHDYNQYRAHSSLGYSSPHEFMALDMALDVKTQRMVLNRSGRQRGFYAEN